MSLLEKITQLKKDGMSEREIISILQEEGKSPGEIMDALNQSQIKRAVSAEEESSTDGMTPSMMQDEESLVPTPEETKTKKKEELYAPQAPIPSPQEEVYSPQNNNLGNQNNNYYTPQGREEVFYEGDTYEEEMPTQEVYTEQNIQGEYSYSQDTTIEIAEQVVAEKMKKFQFQLREAMEFKTIFESRLLDLSERLTRIEKMFDKMQITIIDKVSNYGENLNLIKKEMNMIEDSFAKVINPLLDKK